MISTSGKTMEFLKRKMKDLMFAKVEAVLIMSVILLNSFIKTQHRQANNFNKLTKFY